MTRDACFGWIVAATVLFFGFVIQNAAADTLPGGWYDVSADPVSPFTAREFYRREAERRAALAKLVGAAGPVETVQLPQEFSAASSPEIVELARGLQNDPKQIYEFVHNRVQYSPYYGWLKHPVLTLNDRAGNDFDQAALMISLLRTSGVTARYVFGEMTVTQNDLPQLGKWLGGISVTAGEAPYALTGGGVPVEISGTSLVVSRVWVEADISGTSYQFDPAFKSYDHTSARINLAQVIGYDRNDFLEAARQGATVTADYVQNLNTAGIRSKLTQYSTSLVAALENQFPNSTIQEVFGLRTIIPVKVDQLPVPVPFARTISERWDEIPDVYRATLRIQHEGIDRTLYTAGLPGARLTITYPASQNYRSELRLDGILIASGHMTDTAATHPITVTMNQPYPAHNGTFGDQTDTASLPGRRTHAVLYAFGEIAADERQRELQRQLSDSINQGLAQTSEPVLGGSLNVMGNAYNTQVFGSAVFAEAVPPRARFTYHHAVGFMKEESPGYVIDYRLLTRHVSMKPNDTSASGWPLQVFQWSYLSALEHGVLEQKMGADKPAVSTIKMLQVANDAGRKVYRLTTQNFDSVKPALVAGGWSSSFLDGEKAKMGQSAPWYYYGTLPEVTPQQYYAWSGNGYLLQYPGGGYLISGGAMGGGAATATPPSPPDIAQNSETYEIDELPNVEPVTCGGAVNLATGAETFSTVDLTLGSAAPLGLAFQRSYNSGGSQEARGLGHGWSHSYDMLLTRSNRCYAGYATRQPWEAASLLAMLYVGTDLLTEFQNSVESEMIGFLALNWAADQYLDNDITVNLGEQVLEFIKLPDGSWSPPPGVTASLIDNSNGTFSLQERLGNRYNFNADDRIATIVDPDDNTMTFTYTGDNLTQVQDAFGRTLALAYDGQNRIQSVSDSAGRSVSYGYDGNGDLVSYTDPENYVWTYGYDSQHRMTSRSNPLGITETTLVYDGLGRVKEEILPRQGGATATYKYFYGGPVTIREDPLGAQTIYQFDDNGRLLCTVNATCNCSAVVKQYDGQGHIVASIDARGNITRLTHDDKHNVLTVTDADNNVTTSVYDSQSRTIAKRDALGGVTTFSYDANHHQLSMTDPLGRTTQRTFHPRGMPRTIVEPGTPELEFLYDDGGNVTQTKVASHLPVTSTYDPAGQLLSRVLQSGATLSTAFDRRGLRTMFVDELNRASSSLYDDAGRLTSSQDRNGQTVSYSYAFDTNVDTVLLPDEAAIHYTYDARGDVTAVQDALGLTLYSYDSARRLVSTTDPHGFMVSYEYDAAGNTTAIRYPNDKVLHLTYDGLSRLATVTDWLGHTARYKYNGNGRVIAVTQFNGIMAELTYDAANRLIAIVSRTSNGAPIASHEYTLNPRGLRTAVRQSVPLAALVSSRNDVYVYNQLGTRLQSIGALTCLYDSAGQILRRGDVHYAYNARHNLVGILEVGGEARYSYDHQGRRLKSVRNGVETRYVYSGHSVIAEADNANNIKRYYVYGRGLLALIDGLGNEFCYIFDGSGNTIALTDAGESVVNAYSYLPFGELVGKSELIEQPLTFVGQHGVTAEQGGLYLMGKRYYDSVTGRFMSQDPQGFGGGDFNLYTYAGNNPVSTIDSGGTRPLPIDDTSADGRVVMREMTTTERSTFHKAAKSGQPTKLAWTAPLDNGKIEVVILSFKALENPIYKCVLAHENQHAADLQSGRYGDLNCVAIDELEARGYRAELRCLNSLPPGTPGAPERINDIGRLSKSDRNVNAACRGGGSP